MIFDKILVSADKAIKDFRCKSRLWCLVLCHIAIFFTKATICGHFPDYISSHFQRVPDFCSIREEKSVFALGEPTLCHIASVKVKSCIVCRYGSCIVSFECFHHIFANVIVACNCSCPSCNIIKIHWDFLCIIGGFHHLSFIYEYVRIDIGLGFIYLASLVNNCPTDVIYKAVIQTKLAVFHKAVAGFGIKYHNVVNTLVNLSHFELPLISFCDYIIPHFSGFVKGFFKNF